MLKAADNIVGVPAGRRGAGGAQPEGLLGGPGHPVILADDHVRGPLLQQVHPETDIFKNIKLDRAGSLMGHTLPYKSTGCFFFWPPP